MPDNRNDFDENEYVPRNRRKRDSRMNSSENEYEDIMQSFQNGTDRYEEYPSQTQNRDYQRQYQQPRYTEPVQERQRYYYDDDDDDDYDEPVRKRKKKKKKRSGFLKKFILTVISLVLVLVIVFIGTIYSMLGGINYVETDTKWSDTVGSGAPDWTPVDSWRVKNILVLGIDDDGSSGSRSDTMMILSIDRLTRQMKLVSLLRDLYVTVPGHGETRLNHAYSYGGEALLMQTVESNFRIKIDQFVSVNFDSFASIVGSVGGVTIEITDAEAKYINKYVQGNLTGGKQRLTGEQALMYSRIRALDSDFGRTGRQRTMIEALMQECRSMGIKDLLGIVGNVAPNITTNISRLELSVVGLDIITCWGKSIEEFSIPSKGSYQSKTIKGMSVLVPDMEKTCNELHTFLYGKTPK